MQADVSVDNPIAGEMSIDPAVDSPQPPRFLGRAQVAPEPFPGGAQRALTFALLVSATRCTIQYVLLPFVLPWIGVAAAIPRWITFVLGAIALASLTRNVRKLWRTRHARRWSYLFIAGVVAASLVLFAVMDLRILVFA
ncbi:MAG: hypothetical protein ACRDFS_13515 [Chloroflexota bacterium]